MIITSTSNSQIKEIRKLREKKGRMESGLYYIEGLRIVIEAFKQNAPIEKVIFNNELLISENGREIIDKCAEKNIEILEVSRDVFETLALKDRPQGLAAILKQKYSSLEKIKAENPGVWTALDSIADPGNLGTVMRTMDAIGGKGIILLDQCTDPFDPTTTRASMGALFSMILIKTTADEFINWKKKNHIPVFGTSDKAQVDYRDVEFPKNMILLMGSERQGMQEKLFQVCDQVVRIPMVGISDSLNLSIANAVILYEIFHQNRSHSEKAER